MVVVEEGDQTITRIYDRAQNGTKRVDANNTQKILLVCAARSRVLGEYKRESGRGETKEKGGKGKIEGDGDGGG